MPIESFNQSRREFYKGAESNGSTQGFTDSVPEFIDSAADQIQTRRVAHIPEPGDQKYKYYVSEVGLMTDKAKTELDKRTDQLRMEDIARYFFSIQDEFEKSEEVLLINKIKSSRGILRCTKEDLLEVKALINRRIKDLRRLLPRNKASSTVFEELKMLEVISNFFVRKIQTFQTQEQDQNIYKETESKSLKFEEVKKLLNNADITNVIADAKNLVTAEVRSAIRKELFTQLDDRIQEARKIGNIKLDTMGVFIGISADQKVYRLPLIATLGRITDCRATKIVDYFRIVFGHDLAKDRRAVDLRKHTTIFD